MKYRNIGTTGLSVSEICLGTMNFGEQVSEEDAHEQMDYAVSQGITFFDTAEIYPIPPNADSQGKTETYIGNWLKKRGNRDKLIIASKVVGRDASLSYIRGGQTPRLDRKNIRIAIDGSLKRLQTDYIDLYQVHWPDRPTNYFGRRGYKHDPEFEAVSHEETLSALAELIKEGKIRYIGVSNETAWGVMECFRLHREKGLPRIQSIQNAYSLIMREYETALAEISIREKLSLLAYSPLSMGVLTGKYLHGKFPPGSRYTYKNYYARNGKRYNAENAQAAIESYVKVAEKHKLDPAQLAIAFANTREFMTSVIIGATTMKQLQIDIDSTNIKLSKEILTGIEEIHSTYPNPIT